MICEERETKLQKGNSVKQRFFFFFFLFGWFVNFQTPALDLSGSHAAVVKALLLNPLIFKQCATAMLTQTTNWRCCFSGNRRFRWKKLCLSGHIFFPSHNCTHRCISGGCEMGIFLRTKCGKARTSCILFRHSLPTLRPSMTLFSICMNSIS